VWYLELGGSADSFVAATFKQDLSAMLSHVQAREIEVVEPPTPGLAPPSKWQDVRKLCPKVALAKDRLSAVCRAAATAHDKKEANQSTAARGGGGGGRGGVSRVSSSGGGGGGNQRRSIGVDWYSGAGGGGDAGGRYEVKKNDGAYHLGVQV
jgi:hypothetical protein